MLVPGDPAPTFTLLDDEGAEVALEALRGRKVLVYFYPRADTPGCTTQAQELTQVLPQVGDVAVLGISPDEPAKQARFRAKCEIGFPLLADEDHAVAEAYDVWKEKSMYGKKYLGIERSAFLLDEQGVVQHAWYKVSPKDTAKHLLKALRA